MLRLAWSEPIRVAGQRDMRPSRLAWFDRPTDPKQLWTAHPLDGIENGVSGLIFAGRDLIAAERHPPGRVLLFARTEHGFGAPRELARTNNLIGIVAYSNQELLMIEKNRVVLLRH